ncbi:ycaC protein, variant 2 [Coprinopsis cinerea AmutBmut pab1-1]|nr:ycaC protein, variant 2 [Coprinopsis cinerea AmutBmut pab1-1]
MLFHKSLLFVAAFLQLALAFEYVRIDKNNAALVIIDHQVGLMQMVRDQTPEEFRNNVFAHAALGALYNLPTVITSSAESGPNGPIPQEILDMHPNATIVRRGGEVNSWDSEEFKAAVRATGKNQIIIAGITTDVSLLLFFDLHDQTIPVVGLHHVRRPLPHPRGIHRLCQL